MPGVGELAGHPDRERWNTRYEGRHPVSFEPHPAAVRALSLGVPDGPVADLACAGRDHDGLDRFFHHGVGQHYFKLRLGNEIYAVFAAAVNFGVAFLPAVAARFENGHAFNAHFEQGVFY